MGSWSSYRKQPKIISGSRFYVIAKPSEVKRKLKDIPGIKKIHTIGNGICEVIHTRYNRGQREFVDALDPLKLYYYLWEAQSHQNVDDAEYELRTRKKPWKYR